MNKLKVLVLILLFINLFPAKGNGQDSLIYNKLIIKIAPLSLVDLISFPCIQIGLEYMISPKFALEGNYGVVLGNEMEGHKGHGFKTKFEIRRYIFPYNWWKKSKFKKNIKMFYAFQGYFNKLEYSTFGSFMHYNDSAYNKTDFYAEDYYISKSAGGFNLKFGFKLNICTTFVFNAYAGIGVRIKQVNHADREFSSDAPVSPGNGSDYFNNPAFRFFRDHKGQSVAPNLVLGVSLGYALIRKKKPIPPLNYFRMD